MRRARLDDMAFFAVAFHFTPTEYYALTGEEREALVKAHQAAHRKK